MVGTRTHLHMGDNPCQVMDMVKCQEVQADTDAVILVPVQDGTRARGKVTVSVMAM